MGVDIKTIKEQIIKSLDEMGISIESIILFGSRARGDYNEDSDYDILIITKETFPIKEKMHIFNKVNDVLAKMLIPCDIIIKSHDEVDYFRNKINSVVRDAIQGNRIMIDELVRRWLVKAMEDFMVAKHELSLSEEEII